MRKHFHSQTLPPPFLLIYIYIWLIFKHIYNTCILLFFLIIGINDLYSQQNPIFFFEDFENNDPNNPSCYELHNYILDGNLPGWGNYNNHTFYVDKRCSPNSKYGIGFLINDLGSTEEYFWSYPYYAKGNNSIGISQSAFAKYLQNTYPYVFERIGFGLFYNNAENLYFGPAQKYIVNLEMLAPMLDANEINGKIILGYRDAGDELINTSSQESPAYNYYDDIGGESDNIYGIIPAELDLGTPKTWKNRKARIWNTTSFSNATQFIITFDEFTFNSGERWYQTTTLFLDNISVQCDPKEILVEVKELVSDYIDESDCTKKRRYRVDAKYDHCIVDHSKLTYEIDIRDQNGSLINSSIGNGEYFDVSYDINTYPEVSIEVSSTEATIENGYYFFQYLENAQSPLDFWYTWKDTDVLWENDGNDLYINSGENIEWTGSSKVFGNNIIINSGATLTIKNKVYMNPGKKIDVRPGGKLILDGGELTSCGEKWVGVTVRGELNQNQNNPLAHGSFESKNQAKIENAVLGVGNYPWPGVGGGIIKCQDTEFFNCTYGAFLSPYNFVNISHFDNCSFSNGTYGVYMYGNKGIEFNNNVFENLDLGIWATDSKFEVRYVNIFRNISGSGILSSATAPGLASVVVTDNNQFWDNTFGITLYGNTAADYQEIRANYFDNCYYGIEVNGDNIYRIEENRFNDCSYGVLSYASGVHVNEIRCNEMIYPDWGNIYMAYENHQSTFLDNNFLASGSGVEQFDFRAVNAIIDDNIGHNLQPAMNLFSSQHDIETVNTNHFNYWTPKDFIPGTEPQNPGNYSSFDAEINTGSECSELPTPVITDQQIIVYKDYYCYWWNLYRQNPLNLSYRRMYFKARRQFHLSYYYWSIQKEMDLSWQDIENLLLTMCGDKWKKNLYGLYLYHKEYVKAERILDEMSDPRLIDPPILPDDFSQESRNSFVATQRINLKFLKENYLYQPTATDLQVLITEADKNIPERAYARGLYTLFTGEILAVELPEVNRSMNPRSEDEYSGYWFIHPNPASDKVSVNFSGKSETKGIISVFNILGNKIMEESFVYLGPSQTVLDLSSFKEGVYFIYVDDLDGRNIFSQKMIVNRK